MTVSVTCPNGYVSNSVEYQSTGYCDAAGSDINPEQITYLCEVCGLEVTKEVIENTDL